MTGQLAAGEQAETSGDYVGAAAAYRALIASSDEAVAAQALFLLARVSWRQGRFDAALAGYDKAGALAERLGDRALRARVWNGVGATHYACGEYALARQAYAEAVAVAPDAALQAMVILNLGALENAEGRHALAREHYHRAYELFVALHDDANASLALHNRGLLDAETAQWVTADASFVAALALATEAGNRELIAKTLVNRSEVLVELGHLADAVAQCDRALGIFGEIGDEVGRGEALRWRSHALGRGGDYAAAERNAAEAMHIALRAGARLLEAQAARDLGVLRGLLGDRAGGVRELRRSLALFTELGARREAQEIGQLLQRPTPNRSMQRIELAEND